MSSKMGNDKNGKWFQWWEITKMGNCFLKMGNANVVKNGKWARRWEMIKTGKGF